MSSERGYGTDFYTIGDPAELHVRAASRFIEDGARNLLALMKLGVGSLLLPGEIPADCNTIEEAVGRNVVIAREVWDTATDEEREYALKEMCGITHALVFGMLRGRVQTVSPTPQGAA